MPSTLTLTGARLRALVTTAAALVAALGLLPQSASALTMIDFDGYVHGEVLSDLGGGVSIVADNSGWDIDLAVAFDSQFQGPTADDDLTIDNGGQNAGGVWSGGNLAGTDAGLLGRMLILQENDDGCDTGICSDPDDEGRRPAGTLTFLFEQPILSFGFALVDIDSTVMENGALTVRDGQGGAQTITFEDLLAGYEIGNNTANQIKALDLTELKIGPVTEVEFLMGGSGAIDNVNFEVVPEPTTAVLLGLGLLGLARAGRPKRA